MGTVFAFYGTLLNAIVVVHPAAATVRVVQSHVQAAASMAATCDVTVAGLNGFL
eukprot:COSAG02_NODE_36031_length_460_cov_0.562327_1_plen_53_part_10